MADVVAMLEEDEDDPLDVVIRFTPRSQLHPVVPEPTPPTPAAPTDDAAPEGE